RALLSWIQASPYHETDGDCSDFFVVPSHHPKNEDAFVAQLFGYIRATWPWWNRTVEQGLARHILLLACDHGAGDCAYSRPIVPYKWAHLSPASEQTKSILAERAWRRSRRFSQAVADWGGIGWELLNPASPARAIIFLQYNGKADHLRHAEGRCLVCFQRGLDVRLPTPELHMCGPHCGMHSVADGEGRIAFPVAVQRELLESHSYLAAGGRRDEATSSQGGGWSAEGHACSRLY
ncbi:MAG: hypothetical protein SGPRY_009002, partial [Prymnesium sp.]